MPRFPCQNEAYTGLDPRSLVLISQALLQRVNQVYADAGINLPARQIRAVGEDQPLECNMVMVAATGLREGVVEGEPQPSPCSSSIVATFKISVARCYPTGDARGNPPSPDQIAAASDEAAVDAYLLMKTACMFDMWGADLEARGLLHKSALGGMGVEASVSFEGPDGGVVVTTLTLSTVIG
jgi:hypothetical protein